MLPLHHTRFESCVVSDWLELLSGAASYEGMELHFLFFPPTE